MMTPKRNSCVSFALSYTHLKMYGKGAEIDKIRETTTIVVSIDISRTNVIIAFISRECVAYYRPYLCQVSMISIEKKWNNMYLIFTKSKV